MVFIFNFRLGKLPPPSFRLGIFVGIHLGRQSFLARVYRLSDVFFLVVSRVL